MRCDPVYISMARGMPVGMSVVACVCVCMISVDECGVSTVVWYYVSESMGHMWYLWV